MRPRAECDAFRCIPRHIEHGGIAEVQLIAVPRPEHEEDPVFRFQIDGSDRPGLGHPSRRHPDRRYPPRILLEHLDPGHSAGKDQLKLLGVVQQCPDRTGDGIAGLVLPPADGQLDIGPDALHGHPGFERHTQEAAVRVLRDGRNHVVYRDVDSGCCSMAPRFDVSLSGVVGDPVDHGLRPGIHVLKPHVGQPGDRLEALCREPQREFLAQDLRVRSGPVHPVSGRHEPGTARSNAP